MEARFARNHRPGDALAQRTALLSAAPDPPPTTTPLGRQEFPSPGAATVSQSSSRTGSHPAVIVPLEGVPTPFPKRGVYLYTRTCRLPLDKSNHGPQPPPNRHQGRWGLSALMLATLTAWKGIVSFRNSPDSRELMGSGPCLCAAALIEAAAHRYHARTSNHKPELEFDSTTGTRALLQTCRQRAPETFDPVPGATGYPEAAGRGPVGSGR
jgi:hypothetical protein